MFLRLGFSWIHWFPCFLSPWGHQADLGFLKTSFRSHMTWLVIRWPNPNGSCFAGSCWFGMKFGGDVIPGFKQLLFFALHFVGFFFQLGTLIPSHSRVHSDPSLLTFSATSGGSQHWSATSPSGGCKATWTRKTKKMLFSHFFPPNPFLQTLSVDLDWTHDRIARHLRLRLEPFPSSCTSTPRGAGGQEERHQKHLESSRVSDQKL